MTPATRRFFAWLPALTLLAIFPVTWFATQSLAEERKFVVLLVDFPKDGPLVTDPLPNPAEIWDNYFDKTKNAEAGQPGARIDSFSEWWEEVSYGEVTVSGDVYGWVQLPWPSRSPGADGTNGYVIPHIDLQGGFSYSAGLIGESFAAGVVKYEYDFDGVGVNLPYGNQDKRQVFRDAAVDPQGFPVWSPGERFRDLNGNRIYDAGVYEWAIDKNQNGIIDVDPPNAPRRFNATSFADLFGANINYPDQGDEEPTFIDWNNETEWFDSNGDGKWAVINGQHSIRFVAMTGAPDGGFFTARGDWGGTEIWIDRTELGTLGSRAEPDDQGGGGGEVATLWDFVKKVHDDEEEDVEWFDEQWNDNYDFPEPYEDFLRQWNGNAHDFVATDPDYIRANFPADPEPLVARINNHFYDGPDAWSNHGNVNSSNKGQRVEDFLADETERTEQRRRSEATTPAPGVYDSPRNPWLDEYWQTTYGTPAPEWESQIPYVRTFNPTIPIPQRLGEAEQPEMKFEPNRGGPKNDGMPFTGEEFSGSVLPDPKIVDDGVYDGPAEFHDIPSSIYYTGGDGYLGEVTSPENEELWGHDIGANSPSVPPIPDGRIPPAGPLAFNVHGDGGYDGGNQLNVELLTWRTDGDSRADVPIDFDGDGTIDWVQYHRDINLDGLIDLGETPGTAGEFGLPQGGEGRPTQSNYCIDTLAGTRPNGTASEYPWNRVRALEASVAALDDAVDWDEFLGGPPPFGNVISGLMMISDRTPGDTFEPPASGLGSNVIRTRDRLTGLPGIENYEQIPFWGGIGISLNDGSADRGADDPFSDNGNYATAWAQHEYGHMWQGWPDLYDYDIIEDDPDNIINNPIGGWDIMAFGGNIHPGPILKVDSEWLVPVDITHALTPAGSTTLEIRTWEFDRNKTVFYYPNPTTPGEEFWFWRNSPGIVNAGRVTRQAFNIRQPGFGVLVMHVDRTANPEGLPLQQRLGTHFTYQMVQADGLQQLDNNENNGDSGDPWPGSTNAKTWTRTTDPNNRWYNGQGSGLEIVDVVQQANSSLVTFRWSPQELPTFEWVQPPGGTSVNGRYPLKYVAFDQFGGTRIEFYVSRSEQGEGITYQNAIPVGVTTKTPGQVDGVFQANIGGLGLTDGTYTFFAKLVPGLGNDNKTESSWSVPRGSINNVGNGTLTVDSVDPQVVKLERWTATVINEQPVGSETWRVVGSLSGEQVGRAITGVQYVSDAEIGLDNLEHSAVRFTIRSGNLPFRNGDTFTFLTTGLTPHSAAVLIDDGEVVSPQPPIAVARVENGVTSGLAPLDVVFRHDESSDPHDASLTFTWSFGDGAPVFVTSDLLRPVAHTYTVPSTTPYMATLTVENAFGLSDTATIPITVNEAEPPTVRISATPISGLRPLSVTFTGDQTTDPNPGTQRLDYVWDFGDDSSPVTTANAQHVYEKAGVYRATLTVTNRPYNKSASRVVEIRVQGPASDQPPAAAFSVDRRFGNAPLTVQFDASEATDPEGQPLDYIWDFGDGSAFVRGVSIVEHTFTQVRDYNVTLTVVDESQQTDSATLTIVVTGDAADSSSAPVARIVASGTQGPAPFTVAFDASSSTDPLGRPLSFAWDFGDGSAQEFGEFVTHTFTSPQRYSVVLVVANSANQTGAANVSVLVTSPSGTDSGQGADIPDVIPELNACGSSCGPVGLMPVALTILGIVGLRQVGRRRFWP